MTHADDSAGAISLLPAVLLLDTYFFTFLNHIYFYFCDLVSINFAFCEKKYVSTACISHLHLANARYARIRSSCYRHLFWSLIHLSDDMLPPNSGLFQLLFIATPKFRSTSYISCFNRCARWRVFRPVVCWNRCDHCGTLTLDFQ